MGLDIRPFDVSNCTSSFSELVNPWADQLLVDGINLFFLAGFEVVVLDVWPGGVSDDIGKR
jgi:hypothetical protein